MPLQSDWIPIKEGVVIDSPAWVEIEKKYSSTEYELYAYNVASLVFTRVYCELMINYGFSDVRNFLLNSGAEELIDDIIANSQDMEYALTGSEYAPDKSSDAIAGSIISDIVAMVTLHLVEPSKDALQRLRLYISSNHFVNFKKLGKDKFLVCAQDIHHGKTVLPNATVCSLLQSSSLAVA